MAKGYVIYNPLAGNGDAEEDAKLLQMVLGENLEYYDMTRITNYRHRGSTPGAHSCAIPEHPEKRLPV